MTTTPGEPSEVGALPGVATEAAPLDASGEVDAGNVGGAASATGGSDGSGSRRSGRWWALGGALVVAGLVVWLVWPGSSPPKTVVRPGALPSQAVTTVGGQALLAAVQRGETATYHSKYKVVGDSSQIGGTLTLEVWQAPPQGREDTVLVHDGQTTHVASFSRATSGDLCTQTNGGAWSCKALAGSQASNTGTSGILNAISGEVSGHGVSMQKRTIDGFDVTCYTVQFGAEPKLCATDAGVPVLIADRQVSYQLLSLTNDVSDSVFTLPTRPVK